MSVSITVAKIGAKPLLNWLKQRAARNTEAIERARKEAFEDWVIELRRAVPAVVEYLAQRVEELEARLEEVANDPQMMRIYDNFGYEAAREAIDERRRMLAMAAAGILDTDLTIEQKARVERTLRQLDPGDVRTLYALSRVVGRVDPNPSDRQRPTCVNESELCFRVLRRAPSGDVLVAAGCVCVDAFAGLGASWQEAHITSVGQDVLLALRAYVRVRGEPFEVPGRERQSGDRSEDEAASIIRSVSGLTDFLLWTTNRSRHLLRLYQRPKSPVEPGRLKVFIDDGAAQPWLLILSERLKDTELTLTVTETTYTDEAHVVIPSFAVELTGPHDILRAAAELAEAHWS
jgi:hypothetical protein